jgi:hypothetical protein
MARVVRKKKNPGRTAPKRKAAGGSSAVKKGASALASTANTLSASVADVPAEIGKAAGRAVRSAAEKAQETGADLVQEAAHAAGKAVESGKANLAKQVRRNPVAATVTALGVGFIAGVAGRK